MGCEPFKSTPEQFAALIKDDLPKWAKIVKDSGAHRRLGERRLQHAPASPNSRAFASSSWAS